MNFLRRYWPALLLTVAVLAILDATLSSLLTCHPISGGGHSSTDGQQAKEHCTALGGPILLLLHWVAETSHKYEGLITAAFTIVLALFTGRPWFSTEKLANSTKQLVEGADDTARRQLRAYVNAVDARVAPLIIGSPIGGFAKLTNAGQTPAYEFKAWVGVAFIAYPHSDLATEPTPGFEDSVPSFVLAPKADHLLSIGDTPLTQSELDRLTAKTAAIRVFGRATYKDAFGAKRTTNFRFLYGADWMTPSGAMVAEREGNTSD